MTATDARPNHWLRIAGVLLATACVFASGCSHHRKRDRNLSAEGLYTSARKSLDKSDYDYAVKQYEALTSHFPFSDQARQARLDIIYAYYRKGENEAATDAAKQFLEENPTHPRVDYAWYMQGLIDFERVPWKIERWFGVDPAKRPPAALMTSINAFSTVVTQYPKSVYAHDAQRRLVYLRNRLADYEINVARWYVRRGAWLAAAQRAQRLIEKYDGAPAVQEALEIQIECYHRLGLAELQANAEKVYRANYDAPSQAGRHKSWWHVWGS